MKLPNADQAVVPEAKITRYLLDLTSPKGKSKAVFFRAFGFTIGQWQIMADALRQHAAVHQVTLIEADEHGTRYVIDGALTTPDGRNPQVRAVWIVREGETEPGFVSAYPLK